MNIHCPICNSKFGLEQVAHDALLHDLIGLASKFGKHWGLVTEYVACFRTSVWGTVNLTKQVRILKELWSLFERSEFEYQGKKYRTDTRAIALGITTVVNLEKWGFQNHNYLKKVLLPEAARLSAEGLTAQEEQAREEQRRKGRERGVSREACPVKREEKPWDGLKKHKEKLGIESLAAGIGKAMP